MTACALGDEVLYLGSAAGIYQRIAGWESKGAAATRKTGSDVNFRELLDEYACAGHVRAQQRNGGPRRRTYRPPATPVPCFYDCGRAVDPADAWQRRTVGWTEREHPGKNILCREPRDQYAHARCVEMMQGGLNPGQGSLL